MELKDFIKQYKSEINALNFKEVYYQASLSLKDRGKLTELFYKLGVDPLKTLDYIPEYFLHESSITSFVVPNHIKVINEGAFLQCYKLKSIIIPNSVISIEYGAFTDCSDLTSVILSDNLVGLPYSLFRNCISLTSVIIPDKVKSLRGRAFSGCKSLANVTIPSSITFIEDYAFENCNNLTKLIYTGSKKQWDSISIGSDWNRQTPLKTIHCRDGIINV